MHGILKQDVGPYAKGMTVSTDRQVEAPAVYVDPVRFAAWQAAGLLKSVKKNDDAPATPAGGEEGVHERAAAFAEAVTGEAPELEEEPSKAFPRILGTRGNVPEAFAWEGLGEDVGAADDDATSKKEEPHG